MAKENPKQKIEDKDDKPVDSRKSLIAVLAIIASVVIIIIAIILITQHTQASLKNINTAKRAIYNSYEFNKMDDNAWYALLSIKGQPYNIPFYYNPYEVSNVSISDDSMKTLATYINTNAGGIVYITVDPFEKSQIIVSAVEVARIFGQKYNILNMNVIAATSSPASNSGTAPIINCSNATSNQLVIYMTVGGNKNSITSRGNCIIMRSVDVNESIRVADAMTFRILRITP